MVNIVVVIIIVVVVMVVSFLSQRQADAAIFATTIHSVKADNVAFRLFLMEFSAKKSLWWWIWSKRRRAKADQFLAKRKCGGKRARKIKRKIKRNREKSRNEKEKRKKVLKQ